MQAIIIVATVVIAIFIMLVSFFDHWKHLLELFGGQKHLKAPAWNIGSKVINLDVDSSGNLAGLVYTGAARNPGRNALSRVVRHWQLEHEKPFKKWLHGVTWEYQTQAFHESSVVRAHDMLCTIDYRWLMNGIDISSGQQRWSHTLSAEPIELFFLDEDGSVRIEFCEGTWLKVNPEDGSDIATGRLEASRSAQDIVTLSASLVTQVDTCQAVMDGVLIQTAQLSAEEDEEGDSHRAIMVKPASDAYGIERHFNSLISPKFGRYELALAGRKLNTINFAVAGDRLVFLSGQQNKQNVDTIELYAEVVDLKTLETVASIALGLGTSESTIQFAYTVGATCLAIDITDVRDQPTDDASLPVTFLLEVRTKRLLAKLFAGDQPVQFLNAEQQTLWRGQI